MEFQVSVGNFINLNVLCAKFELVHHLHSMHQWFSKKWFTTHSFPFYVSNCFPNICTISSSSFFGFGQTFDANLCSSQLWTYLWSICNFQINNERKRKGYFLPSNKFRTLSLHWMQLNMQIERMWCLMSMHHYFVVGVHVLLCMWVCICVLDIPITLFRCIYSLHAFSRNKTHVVSNRIESYRIEMQWQCKA